MNGLMITSWELVVNEPATAERLQQIEGYYQNPDLFVVRLIELFEEVEKPGNQIVISYN